MNPLGTEFLLVKEGGTSMPLGHRVPEKKNLGLGDVRRLLLDGHGGLALAVAEIIQLGTADGTTLLDLNLGNSWRMKGEYTLYTLSEADATDREVGVNARSLATDDNAGILLDALLVTFDDTRVNADGITHLKGDEVGLKLLFFDGGDDAHVCIGGRKVD
jgi:hypothetical protein